MRVEKKNIRGDQNEDRFIDNISSNYRSPHY